MEFKDIKKDIASNLAGQGSEISNQVLQEIIKLRILNMI